MLLDKKLEKDYLKFFAFTLQFWLTLWFSALSFLKRLHSLLTNAHFLHSQKDLNKFSNALLQEQPPAEIGQS